MHPEEHLTHPLYFSASGLQLYMPLDKSFYKVLPTLLYRYFSLSQQVFFSRLLLPLSVRSSVQAGYTEIENKVVEAEEWKQAYIDWVNGWITKSNLATFQLFDLNGDAIPEIVAFGSDMSEGAEVATWGVGTVQTIPLDRMEAHYIPGGNVIDNSGGMSEDWYDTIYKIQDGQWVQIGNGTYSVPGPDEPDIPMEDENGNYNFINFKWKGTPMSKEDYQQQVKKLIDLDNAVFMDGENNSAVSVSEIVSQIENY